MLKSISGFIVAVFVAVALCGGQEKPILLAKGGSESAGEFQKSIRPLLVKYCADCHAAGNSEGLEFLEATTESDLARLRGVYSAVVEQLENHSMPPPGDFDQPSDAERKTVSDWLRKALDLKPADTDRIAQYVVAAYEDKKGNLWFGTTAQGAVRFDGKTLTWFSTKDGLPSNVVTSFVEDRSGHLWMGTHEGICRFDGKSMTRFGNAEGLPEAKSANYDPLPAGGGGVQVDRAGNVWANMNHGVFRFDGTTFVEFKIPFVKKETSSYAIFNGRPAMKLHDREGNLWFGTDGYGAFKFDGTNFTQYTQQDGLCSNTVNNILQDRQGNIWFACMQAFQPKMTGDGGVCRFDGNKFTTFPQIVGLSQNDIYTMYETRGGDLWIGATGVGAYRHDGKTFTLFDETDKPHWTRHFGLQSMLEDRNGSLWCGFSGGLFRFNGHSFSNVTADGPWSPAVSKEHSGNEDIQFPTGRHGQEKTNEQDGSVVESKSELEETRLKEIQRSNYENGLKFLDRTKPISQFVRRIFQDSRGHLWFGTNGDGVARFDGENLEYFSIKEGFGGVAVRGIVEDQKGNIWFGSEGGLTKFDGESFVNFTEQEGLISNDIWSIAIDSKGIIWIGTLQGVCRFDGEVFTPFDLPESAPDPDRGVTSARIVHSIMEDSQGRMWFGTNGGAYFHDGQTLTNLSEKDGLSCDAVNDILEDDDGNFWFATHYKGVCRWDRKTFTPIGAAEGVEGTEAWSLFKDKAGNIWFPIENFGVYRHDGESFSNFQKEEGLASSAIQSFFEDREGRLWCGGWLGLFRYDGNSFFSVTEEGPWR